MIIMKKIYFTLLAAMALTLEHALAAMTLIFQILGQRQRLPQVLSLNLSLNQISIRKAGLAIIAALCCKDFPGILIMSHNGRS